MTTNNATTTTQAPLFEMRQSPVDGQWRVWTTKSSVELGLVDRAAFEAAGEPAYMNYPVQVTIGVYKTRPPVKTVLEAMGVAPRPRPTKGGKSTKDSKYPKTGKKD